MQFLAFPALNRPNSLSRPLNPQAGLAGWLLQPRRGCPTVGRACRPDIRHRPHSFAVPLEPQRQLSRLHMCVWSQGYGPVRNSQSISKVSNLDSDTQPRMTTTPVVSHVVVLVAYSTPFRSRIPWQIDHRFQRNSITHSTAIR